MHQGRHDLKIVWPIPEIGLSFIPVILHLPVSPAVSRLNEASAPANVKQSAVRKKFAA